MLNREHIVSVCSLFYYLYMAEISNTPQVELWQDVNRKLDKKRLENSLALSLPKFIEAYGENMSKKD